MLDTLPQRLYLLSYTVEKEKFEANNLQFRGQKLRAAALVELFDAGLVSVVPGKEKVARQAASPPDDPFLAEVWHEVKPDPHHWLNLVHLRAHTAESAVREQLLELGEISLGEKAKKKLSLLSQHQVTVNHPDHVLALREKSQEPILKGLDPANIPLDDLALTVLATESDYSHHIFSRSDARAYKKEIKAYGAQFDKTIPGLRKALQTSIAALLPTGGGWGN